jgi:hypothetical protein
MEPPYRFQHIDIQPCWPASEELFHDCERKVTARGQVSLRDLAQYATRGNSTFLDWAYSFCSGIDTPLFAFAPLFGYRLPAVAGTILNPLGILQVCVLCTLPFQDCSDDQLRDLRDIAWPPESPPVYQCSDRPLLI